MKNTKSSLKRKYVQQNETEDSNNILWTPCNHSIEINKKSENFGLPDNMEKYINNVDNLPLFSITHLVEEAL